MFNDTLLVSNPNRFTVTTLTYLCRCLVFFLIGAAPLMAQNTTEAGSEQLKKVFAGIDERKSTLLENFFKSPFPAVGNGKSNPQGNTAYAMAALWKNQDTSRANELLINIDQFFPTPPEGGDGPKNPNYFSTPTVARLWFLFNAKSPFYPGRLSPEAETALKHIFWCWLEKRSKVAEALRGEEDSLRIEGSGNHDIIRKSLHYLCAEALADDPAFRNRKLADGHTVAEHEEAWSDYLLNRYLIPFAKRGFMVEFGAPNYFQYTVECLFNLRDFARSSRIRAAAELFLDLTFADMTQELLDGIRGGAKIRVYRNRDTYTPGFDGATVYSWIFYGSRDEVYRRISPHPSFLAAATSSYKIPPLYIDLAMNRASKGSYAYVSTPPGRGLNLKNFNYELQFPSFIRKVTTVTPAYVLGAFTIDRSLGYTKLNAQNRWMGIIFKAPFHPSRKGVTNLDSRVFPLCSATSHGGLSAYDDLSGLASGSAMIVQRLPEATGAGPMKIYFSSDLLETKREEGGWMFSKVPGGGAYLAVKPGRGTFGEWEIPDPKAAISEGYWLPMSEQNIPVVFQAGLVSDFPDLDAFIKAVKGNRFVWKNENEFEYQGLPGVGKLTWFADKTLPKIDGHTVNLNPSKLFDSPYLESVYDSGVVTVRNTKNENMILDFRAILQMKDVAHLEKMPQRLWPEP